MSMGGGAAAQSAHAWIRACGHNCHKRPSRVEHAGSQTVQFVCTQGSMAATLTVAVAVAAIPTSRAVCSERVQTSTDTTAATVVNAPCCICMVNRLDNNVLVVRHHGTLSVTWTKTDRPPFRNVVTVVVFIHYKPMWYHLLLLQQERAFFACVSHTPNLFDIDRASLF
jgi:hypothetical protein